ncbi:hypothetical protein BX600DRAFT_517264 [Xylariales sp. PMI_506]|nr:hypothetical protein BX600DRAFT_517264 [Xylariales sp. PMI_506]
MSPPVRCWLSVVATIAAATCFSPAAADSPVQVCATVAPPSVPLNLDAAYLAVGDHPFGLTYLTDDIAFACVIRSVLVLDTSSLAPTIKYNISLPSGYDIGDTSPGPDSYYTEFHGVKLSNDKKNLYIAVGNGAVILDVDKAIAGGNDSWVGLLSNGGIYGNCSVEVSLTPDDDYVILSQEFGSSLTNSRGAVEVYHVDKSPSGQINGTFVGALILGYATVSQQFTPDYTKMFVTNEVASDASGASLSASTTGTISVLDVATLLTDPANALLWNVKAGCHPVRCMLGPNGKYLWVTAREANQLLGFDAETLATNATSSSLVAVAQTGTSPVSLAMVGPFVLVADSNRFGYINTTTGVSVINSAAAFVVGSELRSYPQIPTGPFPRDFAVSPDNRTLLVAEYDGGMIQAINVSLLNIL